MDNKNANKKKSAAGLSCESINTKTEKIYEKSYKTFMEWKNKNQKAEISEELLIEYFTELSKLKKPSTLWATYSMIKFTLSNNDNIDISNFKALLKFLKQKSSGFESKKSKVLTEDDMRKFLNDAPDDDYLTHKALLAIAVAGALKREELHKLTTDDVQDNGSFLVVEVMSDAAKPRCFTVLGELYETYKKYAALKPPYLSSPSKKLFMLYQNKKFSNSPMGINKIGGVPKEIAKYLKLPEPELYTGHSFRRSTLTSGDKSVKNMLQIRAAPRHINFSLNSKPLSSSLRKTGQKVDAATMTDSLRIIHHSGDTEIKFVCKFGENTDSSFLLETDNGGEKCKGKYIFQNRDSNYASQEDIRVISETHSNEDENEAMDAEEDSKTLFEEVEDVKPKTEVEQLDAFAVYHCPKCGFSFEEENLLIEHLESHL